MSVYLMPLPDCVIRTRAVAATPFWKIGFAIALPPASTKVIVADGVVVAPMSTGGLSSWTPAVPAVLVNVSISHSAALPLWFAGGVVAVTSMRAQSTLFVARPVPAVSWTSIVRVNWLTVGALHVPDEKAVAGTLMFV